MTDNTEADSLDNPALFKVNNNSIAKKMATEDKYFKGTCDYLGFDKDQSERLRNLIAKQGLALDDPYVIIIATAVATEIERKRQNKTNETLLGDIKSLIADIRENGTKQEPIDVDLSHIESALTAATDNAVSGFLTRMKAEQDKASKLVPWASVWKPVGILAATATSLLVGGLLAGFSLGRNTLAANANEFAGIASQSGGIWYKLAKANPNIVDNITSVCVGNNISVVNGLRVCNVPLYIDYGNGNFVTSFFRSINTYLSNITPLGLIILTTVFCSCAAYLGLQYLKKRNAWY